MVVLLFLLTVLGCVAVDLCPPAEEKGGGGSPACPGAGRAVPFPGGAGTAGRPVRPQRPHLGEARSLRRRSGGAGRFRTGESSGGSTGSSFPRTGRRFARASRRSPPSSRGKRIEFVSPVDGVVCAVNERINADPAEARKEPYEKGWAFMIRPSNLSQNLKKLRIGAEAVAWMEREVKVSPSSSPCTGRCPWKWGPPCRTEGVHVEGSWRRMDGEILQIAIRKYFR